MAENRRGEKPRGGLAPLRGRGQGLYYFSRGQLFVLAAGFTVTSVVVFFLGILIGQGIEERKLIKREEPLVKIPVQPLSQGSGSAPGASAKEEITFYDTLTKVPTGAGPARVESVKEIKPAEKTVKPIGKEAKAVTSERTAVAVEKVKEREGTEKAASVLEAKKEAKSPVGASPLYEAPGKKVEEAEGVKAGGTREAIWTVQVNAFPNERDANKLAKKLTDKGYDAYVVSAEIKGKSWYRVRVGRFATREDAKGLQETLKTKENFTKAMTVSR